MPESLVDHGEVVGDEACLQVGSERSLYMERGTATPHNTLPPNRCVDGTPTENAGDRAHLRFFH